jgi:hypothetical protein
MSDMPEWVPPVYLGFLVGAVVTLWLLLGGLP